MKKLICTMLAVVMLLSLAGCSKMTTAQRFDTKCRAIEKLEFNDETKLVSLGGGKLLAGEPDGSNFKVYVIDISTEKVIKKLSFKAESGYRYELVSEAFADGKFVLAAYGESEFDALTNSVSYYMLGRTDSKKLTKLSVPTDGGVFDFDCTKYYYPMDNEVFRLDIEGGETELAASFNAGSVLTFKRRVDKEGRIHALRVNPDGGDSYLCRFELESGNVSNPIYQSTLSLFVGSMGDHTAMLMFPDDDAILSLQLYLINNAGNAGSDTLSADIGSAFSDKDHTIDTGDAKLIGDVKGERYIAFMSDSSLKSTDRHYTFRLGRIGSEFAEFADLSEFGTINSLNACCDFTIEGSTEGAQMELIAAIMDGKLCIINPAKLDFSAKVILSSAAYANLIPNK